MFVHVYGSERLREWVVEVQDGLDCSQAMAEALRRVQASEAGPGTVAETRYIAVVPEGQPGLG